jgi:hypothetical protein
MGKGHQRETQEIRISMKCIIPKVDKWEDPGDKSVWKCVCEQLLWLVVPNGQLVFVCSDYILVIAITAHR